MTKLQHTIIRASAGTGKTYQLSNRFIALLLLQMMQSRGRGGNGDGDLPAPDRLAALTFTRKGAAEFASRILGRLAEAAANEKKFEELKKDLEVIVHGDAAQGIKGLAPGVDFHITPDHVRVALAAMVDYLDRLCLGTIDSFMARSVQTLAFELGLGGFEILEESAAEMARSELLSQVFENAAKGELDTFYQTVKRVTLKSSTSLRADLDKFAQDYHALVCVLKDVETWGGEKFWEGLMAPPASNCEWKKKAKALSEELCEQNFGHKGFTNTLCKMLTWLSERNCETKAGTLPSWLKDDDSKLLADFRSGSAGEWTSDYSRKEVAVPAVVMQELREILAGWITDELKALRTKTRALHSVISDYEAVYDRYARNAGNLAYSDLPLLLTAEEGTAAKEAIDRLAYRWYQRFDHWLLDEFQDTSRSQWSVLHGWLDEAIQDSEGTKSVFVVGDVKQSIYGWRGGEPRLFGELVENYGEAFCEQEMSESFRSRPSVLELVNRICGKENPAFSDTQKFLPQALSRWQYPQHKSCRDKAKATGYSAVLMVDESKNAQNGNGNANGDEDESDAAADKMAARAAAIKGVLDEIDPINKGLSCAILTRKGDNGLAIAQWLRANGYEKVMVEGDACLADQSPVLAALLDALRWLQTPANTFAEGHLLFTPLWRLLSDGLQETAGEDARRSAVWGFWKKRITQIGAAAVTREWCAALLRQGTDAYTQYCLQQADQLASRVGIKLPLADWISTLEEFKVRETSGPGAIHVMTIHKAKGLGFDIVLLPDLDLGKSHGASMLLRKDGAGVVSGCLLQPQKWLAAWTGSLTALREAQEAEADLEALCVLYVALTRAKEATIVFVSKERDGRRASRAREWIIGGLASKALAPDDQTERWPGSALFWESGDPAIKPGKDFKAPRALYHPDLKLNAPLSRRARKKPSDSGHEAYTGSGGAITGDGPHGREFGVQMHKAFEQIEWWSPALPLPADLPETEASILKECMSVPRILELFTPLNPGDEALRELPLEYIEGNTWWSGVMDRLVLRRDPAGKITEAVLIDFKTDNVTSAESLKEVYSRQLEIYRQALVAALKIAPDQVKTVLVSTCLKTVVEL